MKKILCLLVSLLLLCSAALAESPAAAEQETAGAFSFRNGVKWGMTPEEVQSAEGRAADRHYSYGDFVQSAEYNDVSVSRYQAGLGYMYTDNELFFAFYYIDADSDEDVQYLTKALQSLYGKCSETAPETIAAFANGITGAEEFDPEDIRNGLEWHAPDGTRIWLFLYSSSVYLFYTAPDFDVSQIGVYDVTGL